MTIHSEKMSFGQKPRRNRSKQTEQMSIGSRSAIKNTKPEDQWVEEEFIVKDPKKE